MSANKRNKSPRIARKLLAPLSIYHERHSILEDFEETFTEIQKEDRIKVSCALAYFVTPCDIIPEEEFGLEGFIDDVFLVCYVLQEIKERYGIGLLESLWNSEEDLSEVLEYTYLQSAKIIDEKGLRNEILTFVGLNED